jgi:hypothetical protein
MILLVSASQVARITVMSHECPVSPELSGFQHAMVGLGWPGTAALPHGLWFLSRKLSTFNMYMKNHGYDVEQMWRAIEDVLIKTLISAHPIIKHNYHTCFPSHTLNSACFEILGFDILLDCKLKPWLLEVSKFGQGVKTAPLGSASFRNCALLALQDWFQQFPHHFLPWYLLPLQDFTLS